MDARLYVDETKAKGYVLVAAVMAEASLDSIRQELRALVLPGQRALRMKRERDSRRRTIADTIAAMTAHGVTATVYDSGRIGTEQQRRKRCITAVVQDVTLAFDSATIVFDLDESLRQFDRQCVIEATRNTDFRDKLRYEYARRQSEPLLAVPDAIAWCWARGAHWRERIAPVVAKVRRDL